MMMFCVSVRWTSSLAMMVLCCWMLDECAAQALPPACPPHSDPFCKLNYTIKGSTEYAFTIHGMYFNIKYSDGSTLKLYCGGRSDSKPLETAILPRFQSVLVVTTVELRSCPVPRDSYRDIITALNVTFQRGKWITLKVQNLAGETPLRSSHFAQLSNLQLELHAVGEPSPTLLRGLDLLSLVVSDTRMSQIDLVHAPPTLKNLSLKNTEVTRIPGSVMALPSLQILKVVGRHRIVVEKIATEAGPVLRTLRVVEADGALFSEWAPGRVQTVLLGGWEARRPRPLPACRDLRSLELSSPQLAALPLGWLAACPRLARLSISSAKNLTSLPDDLLANATSLEHFAFTSGMLQSLPQSLFVDARRLTSIDLTDNRLKELPSGVFAGLGSLSSLRLGGNSLTAAVLGALGELPALATLVLAGNARLADPCPSTLVRDVVLVRKGVSGLKSLLSLEIVDLSRTGVSVICSDWLTSLPNLTTLDLRYTAIDTITNEDLQFQRRKNNKTLNVKLEHTPLTKIEYDADDYERDAKSGPGAGGVRVWLGGDEAHLQCDCNLYWAVAALRHTVGPLRASRPLRCSSGAALSARAAPPLLCPRADLCDGADATCRCADHTLPRNRTLLRVDCAGAERSHAPRLRPLGAAVLVDLVLSDNNITNLRVDDLPSAFNVIDLRNNSLERIEEDTVAAIIARDPLGESRVLLAGNRLACDCAAAAGLQSLLRLGERLDYDELRCEGDVHPRTALAALSCPAERAASAAALAAALGAAGALAAVGGVVLAQPTARRRLKQALRALRWWEPPRFDLFLTFHRGREALALEVAAELEKRYAVCLQERDWAPPARLADCYAASVAASRRTVALVCAEWARALDSEERRAVGAAARRGALLAVLLAPPATLPPQGTLHRYLRRRPGNALRWGEPDFWPTMFAALPPPLSPSKR